MTDGIDQYLDRLDQPFGIIKFSGKVLSEIVESEKKYRLQFQSRSVFIDYVIAGDHLLENPTLGIKSKSGSAVDFITNVELKYPHLPNSLTISSAKK